MDKKRITVIAVAGAILLVVAVLGILYFSFLSRSTAKVVLPDTEQHGELGDNEDGEYGGEVVAVTADTVPDVVAVLKRPDNYHIQVQITVQSSDTIVTTVGDLWVMDGVSYAAVDQPTGNVKNTITVGEKVYIWYSDAPDRVFEGVAGNFSSDDSMMMYTYEDIVNADRPSVTEAGYEKLGDTSCIYALLVKNGIETKLWVSVEDGILLKAERVVDGETVYTMSTTLLEKDTTGQEQFVLPDGRTVLP